MRRLGGVPYTELLGARPTDGGGAAHLPVVALVARVDFERHDVAVLEYQVVALMTPDPRLACAHVQAHELGPGHPRGMLAERHRVGLAHPGLRRLQESVHADLRHPRRLSDIGLLGRRPCQRCLVH